MAKLSAGDLIAKAAKHHIHCLVSLYNRARRAKESYEKQDSSPINEGIALAELVAYIEDARADNEYVHIFIYAYSIYSYMLIIYASVGVPTVDAIILDGAVTVNMLNPGTACTFSDYASQIFLAYITRQLQDVQRVDVVWDEYVHGSLKTYTRSVRGKGSRRRVESSNALPRN